MVTHFNYQGTFFNTMILVVAGWWVGEDETTGPNRGGVGSWSVQEDSLNYFKLISSSSILKCIVSVTSWKCPFVTVSNLTPKLIIKLDLVPKMLALVAKFTIKFSSFRESLQTHGTLDGNIQLDGTLNLLSKVAVSSQSFYWNASGVEICKKSNRTSV